MKKQASNQKGHRGPIQQTGLGCSGSHRHRCALNLPLHGSRVSRGWLRRQLRALRSFHSDQGTLRSQDMTSILMLTSALWPTSRFLSLAYAAPLKHLSPDCSIFSTAPMPAPLPSHYNINTKGIATLVSVIPHYISNDLNSICAWKVLTIHLSG